MRTDCAFAPARRCAEITRPMRRLPLVILAAAAAACGRAPDEPAASVKASATTFSREAFAPRSRDAGASDPVVPMAPSDAALAEILGKAPKVVAKLASSISGPAIEQALRAEVYYRLTQRCRARDRSILPPEAVHVSFHLDADGYVVPSSILASAKDERHAEAARCMARELSTIAFRAPPSGRGAHSIVRADVPSVD
jgi:hypothetical protein